MASLLVVDDEEGLLFLMTEALRREGYEVESREKGAEALNWLAYHQPDLLILDLKLNDLPAPELVARLRERNQEIPFIVITGHGDERTAVDVMKQGALDYVMKDAGMLEFLPSIVRRALSVVERERRLVEAGSTIRQREQRHQKIIQTALDGFARFEMDGRIHEVNQALCFMLGYDAEEFPGMSFTELENSGELGEKVRSIQPEEAVRLATRLRQRHGSLLEVTISMRREETEIFAFVHDISHQRRLEREILVASEEERRRIGRDLHDGLGQQLTALEFQCHRLARRAKLEAPELAGDVEEVSGHIRRAITQTRMLSHGLAPVSMDAEGLVHALRDLARLTSAAAIHCEFKCEQAITFADSNAATHLYRIAQEAVTNALKHAAAQSIRIHLSESEDWLELSIYDDGRGIDTGEQETGIGLQVMSYRARLIGGRIELLPVDGGGVHVSCRLPKTV